MCTIRFASRDDSDCLVALMPAFYREGQYPFDPAGASAAFNRVLSDESLGLCWLIEDDGKAVGYIAVSFTFSLEYFGNAAFIEDLYVVEAYRRHGLGKRALAVAEQECRRRGALAIHLEVGTDNTVGAQLYEKAGYEDTDRRLLNKRLGGS